MAEEQKPVEVPKDAPVVETPAETKPVDAPAAEEKPAEDKPAEATEAPAAEAATEAATEDKPAEDKKEEEEPKPVEAGVLEHKGAGANFPKNLFFSKQPFWFGTDALEKNNLATYLKHEKVSTVAHHNASWAQTTGKGLLCFGDKATPTGIINLAEATEPQTDGPNKFHFNANGQKHSFKAATKAEADNWVAQLKLKIAEAKEVAATIAEDETYKAAREAYNPPAPVKKEEVKPAEEKKEDEAPATEEAAKEEPAAEESKKDDEQPKEEVTKDEEPKEKEEPKRRSLSRKRASYLNTLFGKKEKKEDKPAEAAAATEAPAAEDKAAEPAPESPAVEAKPTEDAPAVETPAADAAEDKPEEAAKETPAPKEKPVNPKRNSFFGLLKKKTEAEAAPAPAAKESEAPASSEAAPVIPPVETSASLSNEVATPAEAPAAEAEEAAPATNGEPKKEMKSEKRKSSLPFLGKKDKSAVTSDEEGEKPQKSPSPFSRIRATLKGRSKSADKSEVKAAEKTEEQPAEEQAAEDKPADATAAAAEEPAAEPAKAAEEPEIKPEAVAAAPAPAVTAAA